MRIPVFKTLVTVGKNEQNCTSSDWTVFYNINLPTDSFINEMTLILNNDHLLKIDMDSEEILNININDLEKSLKDMDDDFMQFFKLKKEKGKWFINLSMDGNLSMSENIIISQKRREGNNKKTSMEGIIISYRERVKK